MKNIENEIKILGIDVDKVTKLLKDKGCELEEHLFFKRYIFDTVPVDPSAWVRLRTDGKLTTLTYKKSLKDSIDGMKEIEITVDNIDSTKELLTAAGLKYRLYQENIRDVYTYKDASITIDYWPHIPPYMEIEAKSKKEVVNILNELALDKYPTTSLPTENVYHRYNLDLNAYKELRF